MPALVPRYTAEEIRQFDDDRVRYEVIRGQLFVSPAPGIAHQRLVRDLLSALQRYVSGNGLGEAVGGPFEVEFAEDTSVQPDVLVLLNDRVDQLTAKRLLGPPSLVVEVISYSSKRTDRLQKRALYLEDGVEEYWVVDPGLRQVERSVPGMDGIKLLTERLVWAPRAGVEPLAVDLVDLFERANR